jgi:hypothetical protein
MVNYKNRGKREGKREGKGERPMLGKRVDRALITLLL